MKMFIAISMMFICLPAFAQEMTDMEFINLLLESLGGLKGATSLVIAGVVVKLLLAAFNTPFAGSLLDRLTGKAKLVVVTFLSISAGVIALMSSGLGIVAALTHATVLPMVLVFLNQVYKQFIEKSDEPAKIR